MKAHRLVYHSTLGLRVIQREREDTTTGLWRARKSAPAHCRGQNLALTVLYLALTVLYLASTVLYMALFVLHLALTVLHLGLTVLYLALTVLYVTVTYESGRDCLVCARFGARADHNGALAREKEGSCPLRQRGGRRDLEFGCI